MKERERERERERRKHHINAACSIYVTLAHNHQLIALTWKTSSTFSICLPRNLPVTSNTPTSVAVISNTTFLNLCRVSGGKKHTKFTSRYIISLVSHLHIVML